MLAEMQTIDLGDVTLTQTMIMLGVVPMIVVQLFRAVMECFWPAGPDGIKKPLFMLVGIGITILIFYALAMKDWMMGGIIIGLTATGGYEFTKNMGAIVKKKVPNGTAATSLVLLLCFLLLTSGCISSQPNPRADLVVSQKVFAATVESLTALQQAGKFRAEDTEQIGIFVNLGGSLLDQWAIAIKSDIPQPDIIQSFQVVLNKLIEYQITKGGDL